MKTAVASEVLGRVGRALADESRRRILLLLLGGTSYPSDIANELGFTRANVSNHLACLRGCGLVYAVPEGRRVRYELSDPRLAAALEVLAELDLETPDPCADEAR